MQRDAMHHMHQAAAYTGSTCWKEKSRWQILSQSQVRVHSSGLNQAQYEIAGVPDLHLHLVYTQWRR